MFKTFKKLDIGSKISVLLSVMLSSVIMSYYIQIGHINIFNLDSEALIFYYATISLLIIGAGAYPDYNKSNQNAR